MTETAVDPRTREELDRDVFNAFQKHKFGQFDEAYAIYADVLRALPDHDGALHYMGLLAQQSGKPEDAVKLIQRSLQLNPENPEALNHLGQVYIALQDFNTAEQCFRQALVYDKNHFHAINNLANCFKQAGKLNTALIHYKRAMEIEPRNPICTFNMGSTFGALGRHWDAIEWLTKATKFEPGNYIAHHKLGLSFEHLGKFEEANANFQIALEQCPTYYDSLAALLNSPAHESSDEQIDSARLALREGDIKSETRFRLEHALGKFFDQAGEYDMAFSHFRRCNEIQRSESSPFNIETTRNEFSRYKSFYTAQSIQELSQFGCSDERPIFVVGLPRTGTSLTEQILSSHSQIHGAGELRYMHQVVSRLDAPLTEGGLGGLESAPSPLTEDSIEYLAGVYLEGLDSVSPENATRVVDKLPLNCLHLGLISILFPKARIIHCQRNPLDVALSCYTVLFKMGNDFSNDLESFGQYYKEYLSLMAHWQKALPRPVFELQYENLIREPEHTVRALVEYCNLPWQADCLEFRKNDRAVSTPSKWQVRQKLYTSSIDRWKNYESHFSDLKEFLEL